MKAFEIEFNKTKGIVFTNKAGKARYRAYLSAKDAGLNPKLIDIKVKRSASYDYLTDCLAHNTCFSIDFINNIKI